MAIAPRHIGRIMFAETKSGGEALVEIVGEHGGRACTTSSAGWPMSMSVPCHWLLRAAISRATPIRTSYAGRDRRRALRLRAGHPRRL